MDELKQLIKSVEESINDGDSAEKVLNALLTDLKTYVKTDGWIPVSERLPESKGRYIACLGYACSCELTFRSGEWLNPYTDNKYLDATAWQPLPKPWKGEE